MDYPSEDNWVQCDRGHTHWGAYGAAGALVRHVDPQGQARYFMQLRSPAVQSGGTWSTPGGAMAAHETPEQAALREMSEEGIPVDRLSNVRTAHTLDHGGWAYHTILADSPDQFHPAPSWEHDDHGWFTPEEIDQLPLHPGFREGWGQYRPMLRTSSSPTELCVMLKLPDDARKAIHGWVLEQDWPEGTDLHEPEKYHITLMYTPSGHHEHKDADWIEHMESAKVRIVGIDVFTQDDEGRYPYVLRLHAPEVKKHGEMLQVRAERDHGLEITHFPGGYKPHITVGYGPEESVAADDVVELEFHAGPSFVSPPRKDKGGDSKTAATRTTGLLERGESDLVWNLDGLHADNITHEKTAVKAPTPPNLRDASGKDRCGTCKMFDRGVCWGYGNRGADDDPPVTAYKVCDSYDPAPGYHEASDGAQILDELSLRSVGHNLHQAFESGRVTDAASAKSYAERMLDMIGYPREDMNTVAALQAWQTMYPADKVLEAPQETPTLPTQSWGYGTVSSWPGIIHYLDPLRKAAIGERPLYHWTDVSDLHGWMDPSHTGPGYTFLTEDGDSPDQNPDVPLPDQPVRITIDPSKLDPQFLDQRYEGWLGNHLYMAPIPQDAIAEIKSFRRPNENDWDFGNTEPMPTDRWPDHGKRPEDELHAHDVQFSNDWV